jgi:toxin YoeB
MIKFHPRGWEDYLYWQQTDKATLRRINQLIRDIQREPFAGIGKPEPLRFGFKGAWSRRITDEHRLVYGIEGDTLIVLQCRFHYEP